MKITFTTETGQEITNQRSLPEHEQRLEWLHREELYTRQVAPTDSGSVRDNYIREAKAIHHALGQDPYDCQICRGLKWPGGPLAD